MFGLEKVMGSRSLEIPPRGVGNVLSVILYRLKAPFKEYALIGF
jgi:hypothetical protein